MCAHVENTDAAAGGRGEERERIAAYGSVARAYRME